MVIGGYTMEDNGLYGITVTEKEAGWSFYLEGDAATLFREELRQWEELVGDSFEMFLYAHDYNTLFQ